MVRIEQLTEAIGSKKPLVISDDPYSALPVQCKLNFIGDVHGSSWWYKAVASQSNYSIQVGDINNSPLMYTFFDGLDSRRHKYIHGNHDWLKGVPPHNYLGAYGTFTIEEWNMKIGFISGAYSIDCKRRMADNNDPIHENEELSYEMLLKSIDFMKDEQPDVMVTHCAPNLVCDKLALLPQYSHINSRTSNALDSIISECSPSLYVFGHYHQNVHFMYQNRITFACVNMHNIMPII